MTHARFSEATFLLAMELGVRRFREQGGAPPPLLGLPRGPEPGASRTFSLGGPSRGRQEGRENRGRPGTNLANETEGRGGERTMEKRKERELRRDERKEIH